MRALIFGAFPLYSKLHGFKIEIFFLAKRKWGLNKSRSLNRNEIMKKFNNEER